MVEFGTAPKSCVLLIVYVDPYKSNAWRQGITLTWSMRKFTHGTYPWKLPMECPLWEMIRMEHLFSPKYDIWNIQISYVE